MQTVYKYDIDLTEDTRVLMRMGYKIVHVAVQFGRLRIWAQVNTQAPEVPCWFRVYGTGHEQAPETRSHVGTVLDGSLVWHLYELDHQLMEGGLQNKLNA